MSVGIALHFAFKPSPYASCQNVLTELVELVQIL